MNVISGESTVRNVKYRSRMDIADAILDIAYDGAIKTNIMYRHFYRFRSLGSTWSS